MIPHEKVNEACDIVAFGKGTEVEQRRAGVLVVGLMRRKAACLQWLSGQVIGRGGLRVDEMQQIAAAGARGDDWQAVRDHLQQKRLSGARRPMRQLPPGR